MVVGLNHAARGQGRSRRNQGKKVVIMPPLIAPIFLNGVRNFPQEGLRRETAYCRPAPKARTSRMPRWVMHCIKPWFCVFSWGKPQS